MRNRLYAIAILLTTATAAHAGRRDGRAIHWIEYLLGLLQ